MFLISLLAVLLDTSPVTVRTLDGQTQKGSLVSISAEGLVLSGADGSSTVPLSTLMSVELSENKPAEQTAMANPDAGSQLVILHDGTRLTGTDIARSATQLTMQWNKSTSLEIPTSAVRAIRLQAETPTYAGQWATFLKRDGDKDLLIVPKRGSDGLDFLAGIVSSISPEQVEFLLDGDTIPVPAARVFGVVFAKPEDTGLETGIALQTADGEQLTGRSVGFDGNQFQVQTAWGQTISLPALSLKRLDFSLGRIHYLSDLEPLQEEFSGIDPEGSLFAGLIDRETSRLMYGPRRDTTIDPSLPIRLRGQRFTKGLSLHSRTQLTWALDRKYSSLEAIVGVDDEVAFNQVSKVSVTITGDGETVFQKILTTSEEPVPLKIDVTGIATLSILVDYADNDSSCDWLDLADAKLILATESK